MNLALTISSQDARNGSAERRSVTGFARRACQKPVTDRRSSAAFTLIEIVLALAISGVVLAAVNSVFFSALHLRAATIELTGETLPVDRAIATLKQDLLGILPPGTNTGGLQLAGAMGSDTTMPGQNQAVLLEIFTASAWVGDELPFGDIQRIDYSLQAPADRRAGTGKNLMRGVTRNLLASTPETPQQQILIGDVQNLRFAYFDGTNWMDSWSVTLSNIPAAIKVFLDFAPPLKGARAKPPVQFLVPIPTYSTNVVSSY